VPFFRTGFLLGGSAKLYDLRAHGVLDVQSRGARTSGGRFEPHRDRANPRPPCGLFRSSTFTEVAQVRAAQCDAVVVGDVLWAGAPALSLLSDRAGLSQHLSATLVHGELCRAVGAPAGCGDGYRHSRRESRGHIRRHLRV